MGFCRVFADPGDRETTADRIHATLFGSTQRGAATAATPSYNIFTEVLLLVYVALYVWGGEGGNIIVYLLSVLYLSCGILRLLALRIISQKAMRGIS